jgi:hypothetical protein
MILYLIALLFFTEESTHERQKHIECIILIKQKLLQHQPFDYN